MNQSRESQPVFEPDKRLPSGEWSGFYIESRQPQRGWMHLYLNFAHGKIEGEGTDYVGPWVIHGTYDLRNGVCQWTKQYQGRHRVVYEGKITEDGIQGLWNISHFNSGPFHVWPRQRTDLQSLYMKDDLEANVPSVLLAPFTDGRSSTPEEPLI